MSRQSIGRVTLAVVASYLANGILITATEQFFSAVRPGVDRTPPLYYFAVDLISQCLYTVVGGYLCCLIARPSRPVAMACLIDLGVLVGAVSLVESWNTEPHWYGIALFLVYPPCVRIGWTFKGRAVGRLSLGFVNQDLKQ
jgi:hypothetical protein